MCISVLLTSRAAIFVRSECPSRRMPLYLVCDCMRHFGSMPCIGTLQEWNLKHRAMASTKVFKSADIKFS